MEWVETTGRTIDEAKDTALDQLGVDEQDAEFEVLEEPRTGLFGRTRGEARVRARVRPTQPRPKAERRERRGRQGKSGKPDGARTPRERAKTGSAATKDATTATTATDDIADPTPATVAVSTPAEGERRERPPRRGGRGSRSTSGRATAATDDEEKIEMSESELVEQGEVVKGFLVDLLDAFGLDGDVSVGTVPDDGAVELAVTGEDLGLLIGPKGQTLQAVQELSRSVLQRNKPGETHARVRVDVGGYRERRKAALERFARDIADQVKASGTQKALEPMSPPDRKVVHDTINEIDGVTTISEGEDSRRRVVILPE
jgi:spoIIIJ-associated protein